MAAYVYLLVHARESRFKLGKASDVLARARVLGLHNFSLNKSWALKVPSETRALQVEQALHRIFDPWRVPKRLLRGEAQTPRRGYTEWFRLAVMKRMHAFVANSLDVIQGELRPLKETCALPKRSAPRGSATGSLRSKAGRARAGSAARASNRTH